MTLGTPFGPGETMQQYDDRLMRRMMNVTEQELRLCEEYARTGDIVAALRYADMMDIDTDPIVKFANATERMPIKFIIQMMQRALRGVLGGETEVDVADSETNRKRLIGDIRRIRKGAIQAKDWGSATKNAELEANTLGLIETKVRAQVSVIDPRAMSAKDLIDYANGKSKLIEGQCYEVPDAVVTKYEEETGVALVTKSEAKGDGDKG